jgi:hypothetical protein
MDDIGKWRDLIQEVTTGERAITQAITRETPRIERDEDQFNRADSYSNVTTVADLIKALDTELQKALPLVQKDIEDKNLERGQPILALLQKLSRVNLDGTASQLYALAKQPAAPPEPEKPAT